MLTGSLLRVTVPIIVLITVLMIVITVRITVRSVQVNSEVVSWFEWCLKVELEWSGIGERRVRISRRGHTSLHGED